MNFLFCPLAKHWIGASAPEGLGGPSDRTAAPGCDAHLQEPVEIARIHSLLLGQIVWHGALLPVYLAEWQIERSGPGKDRGVELVFPLDPWELAEAEAFCRTIREAGIGLMALPIAPVSHSLESIEGSDRLDRGPGWRIPDEESLACRARELLLMQVAAMGEWGREPSPPVPVKWTDPQESLAALQRYEERLQWAWTKIANEKETVL